MSCSTRIVGTKCASRAVVGCSSRPLHAEAGTYHVSDPLTLPTSSDFEDSQKYISLKMHDGSFGRLKDVGRGMWAFGATPRIATLRTSGDVERVDDSNLEQQNVAKICEDIVNCMYTLKSLLPNSRRCFQDL
jgi:hypothetical protein